MRIERVVVTDFLDVELETDEIDEELGPTELLGEAQYSTISPGTEVMNAKTAAADSFPLETGYASVDRVLDVGEGVEGIESGDLVMNMGNHASHHRLDTSEEPVIPVPDDVTPREAPFARFAGVSTPAIQTSAINPPTTAGVFGLGLVGAFACQMAAAFGYDVVGFDPLESRRAAAERVGVDATIDPTAVDDLEAAVAADSPRDGCGLVLECSGTSAAMGDAVEIAEENAELLQVGFTWEPTDAEVSAYDVQRPVFEKYLTIRGGWEWQIPLLPESLERYSHSENYAHALGLLARDELAVGELVTDVVDPADLQAVYEGLAYEKDEHLGVVIDW